jgi:hypothetical protein
MLRYEPHIAIAAFIDQLTGMGYAFLTVKLRGVAEELLPTQGREVIATNVKADTINMVLAKRRGNKTKLDDLKNN